LLVDQSQVGHSLKIDLHTYTDFVIGAWTSWDNETPYDYCINQPVFWFVAAGYNIAVDIYIVVVPIPELLKLNLSMRKKLMLVAIFSTGAMYVTSQCYTQTHWLTRPHSTIIVSIARLWALAQYGSSTNPIYDNMLSGIFSPLELNVGIIAMCMPAFRRFVARFLPSCFGSTFGSSNRAYKYDDDNTPNARVSSGKQSGGGKRKQDTLGGSLFETTITKTVDMKVEDEVGLVEVRRDGGVSVEEASQHGPESLYKAQHQETLPKDW
jgi:hypothetical protein